MIVFIPAHAPAPGAVFDPDAEGPLPSIQEADLSKKLCIMLALRTRGSWIAQGRTRQARRLDSAGGPLPSVSVEVHWNAADPPGDYTAVFYAPWSLQGKAVAEAIAEGLKKIFPDVRVYEATEDTWPRVYGCLQYTLSTPDKHAGVLLEMSFLNNPDFLWTTTDDGLVAIVNALVPVLQGV